MRRRAKKLEIKSSLGQIADTGQGAWHLVCHVKCTVMISETTIMDNDLSMSAQNKNEHKVWASNSSRNLYL